MHWSRYHLKDRLFLFAFNVPLAKFISRLKVIILHEYKFLTHKPLFRWNHMILHYAVIAGLYLVQILDFANSKSPPHHNRASMLYGWYHTEGCSFSPTLCHKKTLFHCPAVQSLHALAHCSLLTLFCFLNSGFMTAILPYRPASVFSSQWMLTLFHDTDSVVHRCLEKSAFCQTSWWLWWNCPRLR